MNCDICHQPMDEESTATCTVCDRKFHLYPMPSQGKDCGSIWVRGNACGLAILCAHCYEKRAPVFEQGSC
ncbi:hypothetical protein ACFLTS_05675 [Chloroflexota bacterium]